MEGKHDGGRLAVILGAVFVFLLSIGINALAVPGIAPLFTTDTANVSAVFDTPITPIGWTFQIWALIYTWLIVMHGYILSTICRKNGNGYVYCSPAVLPYGLFVSWMINMCFNCGWLFVWDRGVQIAAMVFLFLVICSNYAVIGFSCHGLHVYGAWLNKYHKAELWLIRVLVQNGVALYTTWTTIATHINVAIVLIYEVKMPPTDAATVTLSVLSVVLLVWFILENFVFEKHTRYILTIYPVVIWALTGNVVKNYDATSPSRSAIFIVVLLAVVCLLFAIRIVLVIWRHIKQPLYEDVSPESMSPMEIAEKQKKIFR